MSNNISKKNRVPALTISSVEGIATVRATRAFAPAEDDQDIGPVEMLTQKFGLNETQVQSAFNRFKLLVEDGEETDL